MDAAGGVAVVWECELWMVGVTWERLLGCVGWRVHRLLLLGEGGESGVCVRDGKPRIGQSGVGAGELGW